jgi:EmrB/QacA subfamily drug resistance transporter
MPAQSYPTHGSRRWLGLALLCTAFFMVILDVAIVNVALPSIQEDLDFSQKNLQWVVSAYALTYGGLLLLGGRAADLLGRRRLFVAGIALFGAASVLGGLAWSDTVLILARAVQGVGAAAMTPAALSLLMTTFAEGRERNTALGVWGAVGASGATVGLLLGGVLTDTVGWEWIFFLNAPIGALVIALTPMLLRESRVARAGSGFDLAGAFSVTAGIATLVWALVDADDAGWASLRTLGLFGASALLLGAFVLIEYRSRSPLLPFRLFRLPAMTGSNTGALLLGAAAYGTFFVVTLYLQQVLGYSPLQAGLAWLALSLPALAGSVAGAQLVTRIGPRAPLTAGLAALAAGVWLLSLAPAAGDYVSDVLPALVITGLGLGTAFVSTSIGALEGVEERDAGLASGLINTAQQVGGALGVAVLSSVAVSRTGDVLAGDPTAGRAAALTAGFEVALRVGAAFAAAGAVAGFVLVRRRPSEPVRSEDRTLAAEPEPAA